MTGSIKQLAKIFNGMTWSVKTITLCVKTDDFKYVNSKPNFSNGQLWALKWLAEVLFDQRITDLACSQQNSQNILSYKRLEDS